MAKKSKTEKSLTREEQKREIIERLKKVPIVKVAVERSGVSRATFYRWKKEDAEFGKAVDRAINLSVRTVNDMAETMLIKKIREGHITAIIFWLKHNHPRFQYQHMFERVLEKEVVDSTSNELSQEEKDKVMKALANSGFKVPEKYKKK